MGDKVEAIFQGAWQKGTVEAVMGNGNYKVHFTGYWNSRNRQVNKDQIRKIPSKRVSPRAEYLKAGDAVEVLEGDAWRPAVVVEVKKSEVRVRFGRPEDQKEAWVPIQRLSRPESGLKNKEAQPENAHE